MLTGEPQLPAHHVIHLARYRALLVPSLWLSVIYYYVI